MTTKQTIYQDQHSGGWVLWVANPEGDASRGRIVGIFGTLEAAREKLAQIDEDEYWIALRNAPRAENE